MAILSLVILNYYRVGIVVNLFYYVTQLDFQIRVDPIYDLVIAYRKEQITSWAPVILVSIKRESSFSSALAVTTKAMIP